MSLSARNARGVDAPSSDASTPAVDHTATSATPDDDPSSGSLPRASSLAPAVAAHPSDDDAAPALVSPLETPRHSRAHHAPYALEFSPAPVAAHPPPPEARNAPVRLTDGILKWDAAAVPAIIARVTLAASACRVSVDDVAHKLILGFDSTTSALWVAAGEPSSWPDLRAFLERNFQVSLSAIESAAALRDPSNFAFSFGDSVDDYTKRLAALYARLDRKFVPEPLLLQTAMFSLPSQVQDRLHAERPDTIAKLGDALRRIVAEILASRSRAGGVHSSSPSVLFASPPRRADSSRDAGRRFAQLAPATTAASPAAGGSYCAWCAISGSHTEDTCRAKDAARRQRQAELRQRDSTSSPARHPRRDRRDQHDRRGPGGANRPAVLLAYDEASPPPFSALVEIGGNFYDAVLDTGSPVCLASPRVVAPDSPDAPALVVASGAPLDALGSAAVDVGHDGASLGPLLFIIVADLPVDVVLGRSFIAAAGIRLAGAALPVASADPAPRAAQLVALAARPADTAAASRSTPAGLKAAAPSPPERAPLPDWVPSSHWARRVRSHGHLSDAILRDPLIADALETEHRGPMLVPPTRLFVDPNIAPQPTYARPIRQDAAKTAFLREQVSAWRRDGICRPASPPYVFVAAAFVVDNITTGKRRVVINYAPGLNRALLSDLYPLPSLRVLHAQPGLSRAARFIGYDLRSAFLRNPLHADSYSLTAFAHPDGVDEFMVTPLGISVCPAAMQRVTDYLLGDAASAFGYVDDVLGYTHSDAAPDDDDDDDAEGLALMRAMLARGLACRANIVLDKTDVLVRSIEHAGAVLSRDGVSVAPWRVAAVRSLAPPASAADVARIAGLFTYYATSIPRSGELLHALRLSAPTRPFRLLAPSLRAFETLRDELVNATTRAFPSPSLPAYVECDASSEFVAAAVSTLDEKTLSRLPIAFSSYRLSPAQQRRSSGDRELLAIASAFKSFDYVLSVAAHVVVISDHFNLGALNLDASPDPYSLRARCVDVLSRFAFSLVTCRGVHIAHVDTLSRPSAVAARDIPRLGEPDDEIERLPASVRLVGPIRPPAVASAFTPSGATLVAASAPSLVPPSRLAAQPSLLAFAELAAHASRVPPAPAVSSSLVALTDASPPPPLLPLGSSRGARGSLAAFAFTSLDYARNAQRHIARPLTRDLAPLFDRSFRRDGIHFYRAADAWPAVPILPRLPRALIFDLHVLAGHLGTTRLYRLLRAYLVAPHLQRDVAAAVADCAFCRRRVSRPSRIPPAGVSQPTGPFDWLQVDTCGPFSVASTGGHRHILVAVDVWSSFIVATPLARLDSLSIQDALLRFVILPYGAPSLLSFDNATSLRSPAFRAALADIGVGSRYIVPYSKGGHARVEKAHQAFEKAIAAYAPHAWDPDAVLRAAFAHNSTASASGLSPFELAFGRIEMRDFSALFDADEHTKFAALVSALAELRLGHAAARAAVTAVSDGAVSLPPARRLAPLRFEPGEQLLLRDMSPHIDKYSRHLGYAPVVVLDRLPGDRVYKVRAASGATGLVLASRLSRDVPPPLEVEEKSESEIEAASSPAPASVSAPASVDLDSPARDSVAAPPIEPSPHALSLVDALTFPTSPLDVDSPATFDPSSLDDASPLDAPSAPVSALEEFVSSDGRLLDHGYTCDRCGGVGELVACATCSRVFHGSCAGLLTADTDDDWTCPICRRARSRSRSSRRSSPSDASDK